MEVSEKTGVSGVSQTPSNMLKVNNLRQSSRKRRESETIVQDDGTNTFFWNNHTVTVLVCVVLLLIYTVFYEEVVHDTSYNVKRGLLAAVFMYLIIGITQTKNGPFLRPHPVFWKLMFCLSILYEILLIFLLFQTASDARYFLTYLDPGLNKPLGFRAYGGECKIYDPGHPNGTFHNVVDKMDGFVPAHLFGWFLKTLILRDLWITNVISFVFELLEYTFEHQLPNFSECWWDHWLLDFAFCNGFGIYFGLQYLKHLEMKQYKWVGLWHIKSYKGKVGRVVGQFGPYSWISFRWKPTENLYRWLLASLVIFMFLLAELNTFYLKFMLWIPPDHPFVLGRLVFIMFWGAVAVREMYDLMGGFMDKMGQQAWVIAAIIFTELMIVLKFGPDVVMMPFPPYIKWMWAAAVLGYITWTIWRFQMKFPLIRAKVKETFPNIPPPDSDSGEESATDSAFIDEQNDD